MYAILFTNENGELIEEAQSHTKNMETFEMFVLEQCKNFKIKHRQVGLILQSVQYNFIAFDTAHKLFQYGSIDV